MATNLSTSGNSSTLQDSGIISDNTTRLLGATAISHGNISDSLLQNTTTASQADGDFSGLVDVDEEIDTPFKAYKRLHELVQNEDNAPELLPIDEDITGAIFDQIDHMQDNLRRMGHTLESWAINIHKMEVDRYSFLLAAYLRRRIHKIEANASKLGRQLKTNPAALLGLLSEQEAKYLANYVTALDEHFESSVLEKLPTNVQPFSYTDVDKPDQTQTEYDYVFVRAQKRLTLEVPLLDGTKEIVVMERGQQRFLPFIAVRPMLMAGSRNVLLL